MGSLQIGKIENLSSWKWKESLCCSVILFIFSKFLLPKSNHTLKLLIIWIKYSCYCCLDSWVPNIKMEKKPQKKYPDTFHSAYDLVQRRQHSWFSLAAFINWRKSRLAWNGRLFKNKWGCWSGELSLLVICPGNEVHTFTGGHDRGLLIVPLQEGIELSNLDQLGMHNSGSNIYGSKG